MAVFEIVEAKRHHCGLISRKLRPEHLAAANETGMNIHHGIATQFDMSAYRKTLLIDGQVAAVGGVVATLASFEGHPWLALSEGATHFPVTVCREARRHMAQILAHWGHLSVVFFDADATALRFARFLGFRRASDEKIPFGNSFGVLMVYQPERPR